jgi:hypothetical protein
MLPFDPVIVKGFEFVFEKLWFKKISTCESLPEDFIKTDCTSDGNIQALNHPKHGDLEIPIGLFCRLIRNTTVFIAEYEGYPLPEVKLMQRYSRLAKMRSVNRESFISQSGVAFIDGLVLAMLKPLVGA